MRFIGLALLAAGCATAGNGNGNGSGNPDAPSGVIDAPGAASRRAEAGGCAVAGDVQQRRGV